MPDDCVNAKPTAKKAERQKGGLQMTEEEKKLLQAKHRLEEVFPWANDVADLLELEKILYDISKKTADC